MRHSKTQNYSQTLPDVMSKTQRAGPSGVTCGDRIGNKPQNTSPQLNADRNILTHTTRHTSHKQHVRGPTMWLEPNHPPLRGGLRIIQYMRWSGEPPQRPNAYQGFLTALQGGFWHHCATAFLHRITGWAANVPHLGQGRAGQSPPGRHNLACASAQDPLHHHPEILRPGPECYPEQFGIGQSPQK